MIHIFVIWSNLPCVMQKGLLDNGISRVWVQRGVSVPRLRLRLRSCTRQFFQHKLFEEGNFLNPLGSMAMIIIILEYYRRHGSKGSSSTLQENKRSIKERASKPVKRMILWVMGLLPVLGRPHRRVAAHYQISISRTDYRTSVPSIYVLQLHSSLIKKSPPLWGSTAFII